MCAMRMSRWQQWALATTRKYYFVVLLSTVGSMIVANFLRPLAGRTYQIPRDHSESLDEVQKYTVVINTWKRHELLEKSVAHYAKCDQVDAFRVVWSESETPPHALKTSLQHSVKDEEDISGRDMRLQFDIRSDKSLNSRFLPLPGLRTVAVLSVDDDVLIDCDSLLFAFQVWQSAPRVLVGFHPRMHLLSQPVAGRTRYKYGGWLSVWRTGSYSMVLTKACFFHRKYLEAYSNQMPEAVRDYVRNDRERVACLQDVYRLVSRAPREEAFAKIFEGLFAGKFRDYGKIGLSSRGKHEERRSRCIDEFVNFFGRMPLVTSHASVRDLRNWLY